MGVLLPFPPSILSISLLYPNDSLLPHGIGPSIHVLSPLCFASLFFWLYSASPGQSLPYFFGISSQAIKENSEADAGSELVT